ncbi:MAG TPA: DUF4019 domain-containing protein [Sphingomonas sp.]|jgi:DNA-binding CsgD family transcriptional regulator|uniref:helix-turn-helix domain-containing protein n=1 Tax=Sphingomonas sp. TaxID=28214 RepID=UPI002EDA7004
MTMPDKKDLWALTEKEKQTLRLIVRGHDAKSVARTLGLSVHTINERLRDARRKMGVSSSREAARLLLDAEDGHVQPRDPNFSGDEEIGAYAAVSPVDQDIAPTDGAGRSHRRPWIITGATLMTLALGFLLFTALPQITTPAAAPDPSSAPSNPDVADTAGRWLTFLDQARWSDSYRATGTAFRKLNTLQAWTAASEIARVPLGTMISRTFVSQENLPAPPYGYEVVKFRTRFANRAEALETVTLEQEKGIWRVVGVTIG